MISIVNVGPYDDPNPLGLLAMALVVQAAHAKAGRWEGVVLFILSMLLAWLLPWRAELNRDEQLQPEKEQDAEKAKTP